MTHPNEVKKTSAKKKAEKETLKALKGIGHRLDPVVTIGANGLSEAVVAETIRALHDHELIKVRLPAGDADTRKTFGLELALATDSELIHHIGRMALLFKKNPEPNDKLSNLIRFGL